MQTIANTNIKVAVTVRANIHSSDAVTPDIVRTPVAAERPTDLTVNSDRHVFRRPVIPPQFDPHPPISINSKTS